MSEETHRCVMHDFVLARQTRFAVFSIANFPGNARLCRVGLMPRIR
jgi:hypothetical protein